MAKLSYLETAATCSRIIGQAKAGTFSPVYLLMGEEPYYTEKALQAIVDNCIPEDLRDFNQSILYAMDTDANSVASEARLYPMMAERRLVVLKDAQMLRSLDDLALYCQDPMETTVLVLLFRGASLDKRKGLYKTIAKCGVVLESAPVKDYEMSEWISSYYKERGLSIDPEAAALFAEFAGADLSKIALETDKMLKNLPPGTASISSKDIESNIGISKSYSIFELTKELSYRNRPKALRIAAHISQTAKFALPAATAAMFIHFYRILRYGLLLQKNPRASFGERASIIGSNTYFHKEYDAAVSAYPPQRAMKAISYLEEYDRKGKSTEGGEASASELFMELVVKLLNC